jgi:ABC-type sulfate transport system permease component
MEDIAKSAQQLQQSGMPASVQITLIICVAAFLLGLTLALTTNFWENISRRRD